MLLVIHHFSDVKISQLLPVYSETVSRMAREDRRDLGEGERLNHAQQRLLDDLRRFFRVPQAVFFVWAPLERYRSALRAEQYRGGLLISCLETDPAARGRGHAKSLVHAAVRYLAQRGHTTIYSHVEKRNAASMAVHLASGFAIIGDHATLLDGTVSQNYYTLQYIPNESTAG